MKLNLPNKQNIAVLSNYRSGSTAFCNVLSKQTGYRNVDEYFHRTNDYSGFLKLLDSNIIVKIMPDQITHQYWQYILDHFYIIALNIRNLVDQITSFYICHKMQIWHRKKNSITINYSVEIDRLELEDQCRYILDLDLQYQKLKKYGAIEVMYDDLDLSKSDYDYYNHPDNYDEIKKQVCKFLKENGSDSNNFGI